MKVYRVILLIALQMSCIATTFLWLRSYDHINCVQIAYKNSWLCFGLSRGSLNGWIVHYPEPGVLHVPPPCRRVEFFAGQLGPLRTDFKQWRVAGFRIGYLPGAMGPIYSLIGIPGWFAPMFFAISTWKNIVKISTSRLQKEGLCPNCGYDLRATPDRCPECGMTVSIPSVNSPP